MWFNIVGATLGFIGSIIFSAGLIKPKDQIRDENGSYWDENPFTVSAGISSQPYLILAFILLITGFAVSLGGMLGDEFGNGSLLVSILFSCCISLFGYLATALFFIHRIVSHQKRKTKWRKSIFLGSARSYANSMRGIEEKQDKAELFTKDKLVYQKDLLEKMRSIPESDNEKERLLIQEIDACSSPAQFVDAIEKYLAN